MLYMYIYYVLDIKKKYFHNNKYRYNNKYHFFPTKSARVFYITTCHLRLHVSQMCSDVVKS